MSWRVLIIESRAKLEYKQQYLIFRGEEEHLIHLSEIAILVIESTAVALTAYLLCELVKNKIKVIFCDEKRNPLSELVPFYNHFSSSRNIQIQINWQEEFKIAVWTRIVYFKIEKQKQLLEKIGLAESKLLENYLNELKANDITNREGHSAKVFFNALYLKSFSRSNDDDINSALNYGYTILLSAINREIVMQGYITQIGIKHASMFNDFNLGSDLVEPFRVVIDSFVFENRERVFNSEYKHDIVKLFNKTFRYNNKMHHLLSIIRMYVQSVFYALETGDLEEMIIYEL